MDDPTLCPACSAPLQLVWVHGHGQCANCTTTVVPCCMGAGQEVDEACGTAEDVGVDDVLRAFGECSDGHDTTTLDSLLLMLAQHHACTRDAALAAVERAVALRRLTLHGRLVKRHA